MTYEAGYPNMISIDRFDSGKGYSKENICLASWTVNRIKSDIHYSDFISICKTISNNII